MFDDETTILARRVIEAAAARGLTLATAESCTGGLVAAALTSVAGSSAVVDQGFVTYSNAAKTRALGVSAERIMQAGAVSEVVARDMAEGAARTSGAPLAVSVTGIAGPGGGTPQKPVGRVEFATTGPLGTRHQRCDFADMGRDEVRARAVRQALEMLLAQVEA